jgi:hypothetical protein
VGERSFLTNRPSARHELPKRADANDLFARAVNSRRRPIHPVVETDKWPPEVDQAAGAHPFGETAIPAHQINNKPTTLKGASLYIRL